MSTHGDIFGTYTLWIDKKGRSIDRQKDRQIDRQKERKIDRYIERQIDRKIDRQIDRQKDRQIDSQIDRQIHVYMYRCSYISIKCMYTDNRMQHYTVVVSAAV